MIFNFTNFSHSSKKCEIKCPESHKQLTTQYKFCLMNADAKRSRRRGGKLNADTCEQWGNGGQKLAKSCGRVL